MGYCIVLNRSEHLNVGVTQYASKKYIQASTNTLCSTSGVMVAIFVGDFISQRLRRKFKGWSSSRMQMVGGCV